MNAIVSKEQRDRALACMVMALCLAGAVFLSVFGSGDAIAIENAKDMIKIHEQLLSINLASLRHTQDALTAANATLRRSMNVPVR